MPAINLLLSAIHLETLPEIQASSSGRLRGRASSAKLIIKIAEKAYSTQKFDAGSPIVEINNILKYISN